MDRPTVYSGALPRSADFLALGQDAMVGLAKLSEAILGTPTTVDGFTLAPTSPASLAAVLSGGSIYEQENLEATPWSALPADSHTIVKQGIALDPQTLTFASPATVGYAQCFLVEASYLDADSGSLVLPYYNAANPSVPFSGPGNAGTANNTVRKGALSVQVKAGIAAPSGTQVVPSPDAGWVGLYVVTLSQGATTVTAGNIAVYASAPFILAKLPAVPAAVQAGQWSFAGLTTNSGNAFSASLAPAPGAFPPGMTIRAQMNAAPTGPATFAINGQTFAIQRRAGAALSGGEWAANDILAYNVISSSILQIAGLTKNDVAPQATYTATPNGGLALTGSAFGLNLDNLPVETGISDADKVPLQTEEAEEGLASGVPFAATAGSLAAYVLTKVIASNTFQQVIPSPTVYVRPDGSDSNNGSANTPQAAFQTIVGAVTYANKVYSYANLSIILGIAGTYAPITSMPKGSGTVTISPAGGVSGCVISGAGGSGSGVNNFVGTVTVSGVTFQNTGATSSTISIGSGGVLTLFNCLLTCTASGNANAHLLSTGGLIILGGGNSQTGNMGSLLSAVGSGAQVAIAPGVNFTFNGTCAFSNSVINANFGGYIVFNGGYSFSGTATGQQFYVANFAIFNTNGVKSVPGSTAGSTGTSPGIGIYL